MRTGSWIVAALAALVISGTTAFAADEKFDGSTVIRGEGEISVLPDLSTISVSINLSCWKDSKAMQGKANAFHTDLYDTLKKFKGTTNKLSVPGINLNTHTLQEQKMDAKGNIVYVNDPECTRLNMANETITFKYYADVAERKKAMAEDDSITGFEKVVEIRNAIADVITKHVNSSPKVDSIKASLNVGHDFSGAYSRSLRSEVRAAAKKDYDVQLAEREKFCQWLQYKEMQVSYSSDNANYFAGQLQGGAAPAAPSAGYGKKDIGGDLDQISAGGLTPGETAVRDTVTVNIVYVAPIKNCQIK